MSHQHHFKIEKVEKLPDNEAEIIGAITLELIAESRKEAVKNLANSIDLPGFRKGQVPEKVLVKTIGEMTILEETAEIALAHEYGHIVEETKLRPVMRPQISVTKLAPGIPLEFKIRLVLEPEFELPDYQKIAKQAQKEEDKEKSEIKKEAAEANQEQPENTGELKRLKLISNLVKATKIELPNRFVDGELNHMLNHFKQDLEKAGIPYEKYLEQIKKTEDEVKETWKEQIVNRAKTELILSKIAEKEKLKTYREVFKFLEKEN